MHLALLTPEWFIGGGIATYCRVFARAAIAQGHRVTVLAATIEPHRGRLEDGRLTVVPVYCPSGGALLAAERFLQTWSEIQADVPDLIEAADFGGVAALVAEDSTAPPVLTRLHLPLAVLLRRNEGRRFYRDDDQRCELERRQVKASALVTSPTRWLAKEVTEIWELVERPAVIPNPISKDWLVDRPVPKRDGVQRILYFGRLEYRKGVLTLADALASYLPAAGNTVVTFIGADTSWDGISMMARMRRLLHEVPDSATIRFLSARNWPALVTEINSSDLVVLPSRYDNMPYTCLQAMARSRPVLGTSGTGFDEIIDDGQTGFLTTPGDSAALTEAIAQCLADEQKLWDVGYNGWRAVQRFSSAEVGPRLLACYQNTMQAGIR
jgi:glycogen(starch) synthase